MVIKAAQLAQSVEQRTLNPKNGYKKMTYLKFWDSKCNYINTVATLTNHNKMTYLIAIK